LPDLIDSRLHGLSASGQQTPQIAGRDLGTDDVAVVRGGRNFQLRRIERIGDGGQFRGGALQDQGLAVADEHVQCAVAVGAGGDPDQLGQARQSGIALIEQFVGRLAACLRRADDDLLVQRRNGCGDRVDLSDIRGDAAIDVAVQTLQLSVGSLKTVRYALRLPDQGLASCRRGGIVRHRRPSVVVVLQRGRQPARRGADDVVELVGVRLQAVELAQGALRRVQLIIAELIDGAGYGRYVDPAADGCAAIGLRCGGRQIDGFLSIPRRVCVRDIVAGDRNRRLKGLQRRNTDSKQVGQESSPGLRRFSRFTCCEGYRRHCRFLKRDTVRHQRTAKRTALHDFI
jgi:hypothetical protein